MKKTYEIFATLFCLLVFCASSITTWQFMLFLSSSYKTASDKDSSKQNSWINLWVDVVLIIIFVMQHSYFKTVHVASYLSSIHLNPHYARCVYTLLTSVALQAMIRFWTPVFSITLWEMNIENIFVWVLHTSIQIIAWGIIYGGALLMDLPELIGIKQIYYYYINAPETSDLKSKELQRLYAHKRHPSFLGFIAILWCTPVMSLDRILLAVLVTLYTAVTWEPTMDDTRYHQRQLQQKQQQIEYSQRRTHQHQVETARYYRG